MPGLEDYLLPDCSPPADGGFLVLSVDQIRNWDLVCLIKSTYPRTKIIVQQKIPVISWLQHAQAAGFKQATDAHSPDDPQFHSESAITIEALRDAKARLLRSDT